MDRPLKEIFSLEDFRSRLRQVYERAFRDEWSVIFDWRFYEKAGFSRKELCDIQLQELILLRDKLDTKIEYVKSQVEKQTQL